MLDASGLSQADEPTVPVYLVDTHAERTSDTATIATALGMTRHDPGGTPVRMSELLTADKIYDPDASLGISAYVGQAPYIVYNDAQRGPGCLPRLRTCTPSTAAAPTGDAAIKQLTRVMTKLGFNTDSFTFNVQSLPSATPSTLVWALPSIHGTAVDESTLAELGIQYFSGGATWSATVTADGIVRLEAELVELTEVATVKTLSPASTAARMTDPAFFLSNPLTMGDWLSISSSAAPLTPGGAIPWAVQNHAWTTAVQSWSMRTMGTGQRIALPAWRLSDTPDGGPGSGWTMVSVPDTALRMVDRVAYDSTLLDFNY